MASNLNYITAIYGELTCGFKLLQGACAAYFDKSMLVRCRRYREQGRVIRDHSGSVIRDHDPICTVNLAHPSSVTMSIIVVAPTWNSEWLAISVGSRIFWPSMRVPFVEPRSDSR